MDDNNVLFFDRGQVTNDLKTGDFSKGGIKFNGNIYILTDSVKKKDDDTYFAKNTKYYICPIDDEIGLEYDDIKKNINNSGYSCKNIFSMESKSTKIDSKKKRVYLKHSFIYFFNIPIFYMPYFYTSKPFIDMVSGFDLPHVESLSEYGTGVYVPYVWYFNDKSSLKLDPVIYQHGSFATKFFYKSSNKNGYNNIKFIYLFDNKVSKNRTNIFNVTEYDEGKYKDNRFYFDGVGSYRFGDSNFFNFKIEALSDNYLYRDYLKDYDDYLKSTIDFSIIDFDTFNYINFNATGFQELREGANKRQKTTPYFVPRIDYHLVTKNILNSDKSTLYAESNTTLLTTDVWEFNKNKYTRYYTDQKIDYTFVKFNSKIKTNFSLFIDAYNKDRYFIDTSNENLTLKKNYIRIIPEVSIDVRSPQYVFNSKNVIFEPILQYYISNKDRGYNNFFINEDSRKSNIDILNLFDGNRFDGLDRREYGERVNYGFNLNTKTIVGDFSFKLGQAYRDIINYKIIGFDNKFSDILSGFGYLNDHFSFDYIMNIDRTMESVRSNSMLFKIYFDNFDFYTNYTYSYNKNSSNYNDFLEEFQTGLVYSFYKNWKYSLVFTYDVDKRRFAEIDTKLDYSNNCFRTGISISVDNYLGSGIGKDAKFNIYFNLKNF